MKSWRKGALLVPGTVVVAGVILILLSLRTQSPQSLEQEIRSSTGLRLVLIPAGEFQMGSLEPAERLVAAFPAHQRKAEEFEDEYPGHRVRISRPFYLGKFEVTVGQYRQFLDESGYRPEPEVDGTGAWGYNAATRKCEGRNPRYSWRNPGYPQTDDYPVVNATWKDANAFCEWLSRRDAAVYRLPTEAEWEYACRAGTSTRYHMGDDPVELLKSARVADPQGITKIIHVQHKEITDDDPRAFPAPVGSYPPNAWRLHDMHGNVWEWVSDWHEDGYYKRSPSEDPSGPTSPDDGDLRVRRGGAWNTLPLFARASYRNYNSPQSRCVNLGFRIVRETAPGKASFR